MRLALFIGLLVLLCGFNPAIEIGNQTEVAISDPLKVTCFKSGVVLYECEEPEFFSDSKSSDYKCKTANKKASKWPESVLQDLKENFWLFNGGEKLNSACPDYPNDYYIDMKSIKECIDNGYKNCVNTVHTNKGWMPKRNRPK